MVRFYFKLANDIFHKSPHLYGETFIYYIYNILYGDVIPTNGVVHITDRYERWRIRDPSEFDASTFRTHDIGRKGYSKRIAGVLKYNGGKWATQSLLISHDEPEHVKRKLRQQALYMIALARRKKKRRRRERY